MSEPLGPKIAQDDSVALRPPVSRRDRPRRSALPGSLWFAATAAALGLVVSLGSGLGTIYVPRLWPAAPSTTPPPSGTTTTWRTTDYPTPTTTVRSGPPVGFYRRPGPRGLVTVLPNSFTVTSGQVTGTQVAKDVADPDVEVRFGGDTQESTGLLETITKAADAESGKPGYQRVALGSAAHRGHDAVEWEFLKPNQNGELRHTRAHYWRVDGIEYVLLVAAPPDRWSEASPILDTMIDHSETP